MAATKTNTRTRPNLKVVTTAQQDPEEARLAQLGPKEIDIFAEFEAELDSMPLPQTFSFEAPGQRLVGIVLGYDHQDTQFQERVPIVTVRTRSGAIYTYWIFHTMLQNEFAKQLPEVGDLIAIHYLGKFQGRQNPYHKFRLFVRRPTDSLSA